MLPQHGQFVRRGGVPARNYYANQYPVHAFIPQQLPQPIFQQQVSSNSLPITSKNAESRARKQVGADFLPSIVNEAYHNVLEQVVTAMCYKEGFDDIEEAALENIMLIFHSYIKRIGEQSRLACEIAGRTIVSPGDVWFGLINMGMKVNELQGFLLEQADFQLTVHPPEIIPVDQKTQSLHIGTPRPHPNYVFDWLPPLPDPHTYIRTEIHHEPELTYEKVREAMAKKKMDGVTSLNNYMVRTYPTLCLFSDFQQIIHEQVEKTFAKESEEKRMEEAFIAFRDLLKTNDIEEVQNVGKMLSDKGLINKHDLESGAEVVCMCSDGALIDQNGQRVKLSKNAIIELEEQDKTSKSTTRMVPTGQGAESLRYHWDMDEMLDELIELDSCTMDLNEEEGKEKNELKYMKEKVTFEYIPEWCHVLEPSYEHRSYFQLAANELKAEEESKKEKEKEPDETPKVKEEEVAHENLYLRPPIREKDPLENEEETEEKEKEEEDTKPEPEPIFKVPALPVFTGNK